tara:strand:- start:3581 stop:4072 length:492 start_codon:yes stop_codon:yes gene_type:complete
MKIDISNGLSGIYLWLIFGITLSLFNCKILKIINKYIYIRYITLLLSIFFLFIILEPENSKKHILILFINSLIIFILFIILIKINKFFSLSIFLLILINQVLQVHIKYIINNNLNNKNADYYNNIRIIINKIIYIFIIIGFIFIIIEKGQKFNFLQFFQNNKC